MAVTSVTLKYASLTGRDDATGLRTYEAVFVVETDSPYDGPVTVKNAPGVSKYGDYWRTDTENDPYAFLIDKNAEADPENTLVWYVRCSFSTATNLQQSPGGGLEVKEIDLAPVLEWDFDTRSVAAYYAYEAILYQGGQVLQRRGSQQNNVTIPIVNSSLDFFDPPIERDESRLVLRIEQAVGDYDPLLALQYANVLNSDTYLGCPPKTILLKPVKAKAVFDKGIAYFRISAELHFRLDLWFHDIWDAGLREFFTPEQIENNKNAKYRNRKPGYSHIKNEDGSYATEPVLLDGFGHVLVQPGKALDLKEQVPCVWRYRTERVMPFGPFPYLL